MNKKTVKKLFFTVKDISIFFFRKKSYFAINLINCCLQPCAVLTRLLDPTFLVAEEEQTFLQAAVCL